MKKARLDPLLLIAMIGFIVLLGIFVMRNLPGNPVQIDVLSTPALEATLPDESGTAVPERININTATQAQLEALPGIGSAYAARIIAYREENGPFRTVGDLSRVEGIGEKRLEALWDLVTTGG